MQCPSWLLWLALRHQMLLPCIRRHVRLEQAGAWLATHTHGANATELTRADLDAVVHRENSQVGAAHPGHTGLYCVDVCALTWLSRTSCSRCYESNLTPQCSTLRRPTGLAGGRPPPPARAARASSMTPLFSASCGVGTRVSRAEQFCLQHHTFIC
jgi:hypothetical protein